MTAPRFIAAIGLVLFVAASAAAQGGDARRYLPDRADEDWSFLKEAPHIDFWDPVKYIPLGREDWFVTLSAEARLRPEGFRIRPTRTRPATTDSYLLQRYLAGADAHLGRRVRVFAEVQSGVINGSLRSPRPTDRNLLDLHQAFVEWRRPPGTNRRSSVKIGRQELAIGSTRLISASPGLNVQRALDGATVVRDALSWTVSGAIARLVGLEAGLFDDRSGSGQLFWGVAASRRSPRFERGELALYYLGIDRATSLYAGAIGAERRHTAGVKWTGTGARAALNYDGLFQWGTFGGAVIRAWAFATETSWQIASTRGRPRASVRLDAASGDRDPADARLQTFNPLFPGNSYAGAVGLLGPTNLIDVTPALRLTPRQSL